VEIPKPDGGVRTLGIPTVVDRLIQQAIAQQLSAIVSKDFSESSYGFRPGRNAWQAVQQAQRYMQSGKRWCERAAGVILPPTRCLPNMTCNALRRIYHHQWCHLCFRLIRPLQSR